MSPSRTAWIALASLLALAATQPPGNPDLQGLIRDAVQAVARQEPDAPQRLAALQKAAGGHREELLVQIAIYLSRATGTEQSMPGAVVLHHLEFTPDEILAAVLPHMDGADPKLRRVFNELLGTLERREDGGPDFSSPDFSSPDFSRYDAWLRRKPMEPVLIHHMYEVSPDAALASMQRLYGDGRPMGAAPKGALERLRSILGHRDAAGSWPARGQEEACADIDVISADPAWWVRLYAEAIVTLHPDLCTEQIRRRLRDDPHPLVRGEPSLGSPGSK